MNCSEWNATAAAGCGDTGAAGDGAVVVPPYLPPLLVLACGFVAGLTSFGDAILFHVLWAVCGAAGVVPKGHDSLTKAVLFLSLMPLANLPLQLWLTRHELVRALPYGLAMSTTSLGMVVVGARLLFYGDFDALKLSIGAVFLVFSSVRLTSSIAALGAQRAARTTVAAGTGDGDGSAGKTVELTAPTATAASPDMTANPHLAAPSPPQLMADGEDGAPGAIAIEVVAGDAPAEKRLDDSVTTSLPPPPASVLPPPPLPPVEPSTTTTTPDPRPASTPVVSNAFLSPTQSTNDISALLPGGGISPPPPPTSPPPPAAAAPTPKPLPAWVPRPLARLLRLLHPVSPVASPPTSLAAFVVTGVGSGIMGGAFGMSGPPQMVAFSLLRVAKDDLRAISTVNGVTELAARLYMFATGGTQTFEASEWAIYVGIIAASWVGFSSGTLVRRSVDTDAIIRLLLCLVFLAAAIMLGALERAAVAGGMAGAAVAWAAILAVLYYRPPAAVACAAAALRPLARCCCCRRVASHSE